MFDILDSVNSFIDDVTGQDWLGDAAAVAGGIATGQWDEVAQHGLDLAEDGFDLVGWEDGAKWAKYGSDLIDWGSDIYHGRYAEALRNANRVFDGPGTPGAPGIANPASPTQDEIAASSDFWRDQILRNGSQGFMDALLRGDASAKAALKDPTFMFFLETTIKDENRLITLISNLIEIQHQNAMASIRNIRV
jgi:hypothetical protein